MSVAADVGVPPDAFVLGEVLDTVGDYYVELTQFVPTGDQLVPFLWVDDDGEGRVERALRDHARIAAITCYDRRAGRSLYEVEWTRPLDDFLAILHDVDVLVSRARGTPDGWQFDLLAEDQDELATFQSACNARSVPIEIRSISRPGAAVADRLGVTEKQQEILQLAYERGYFDVPRQVTLSELGAELQISPQAASKRLRRGLESAVEYTLHTLT
ncbi:MAG: helix-turn-helix domain-containing protein [Haloarculaceae archaeon]